MTALQLDLSPLDAHPRARVVVGFSGGLDSTVLLHALATGPLAARVVAVHVHHGLQPEADAWQADCARQCDALRVPLQVVRVDVRPAGEGREAAAREARHAALQDIAAPGDVVALAHHQDDQAETFLLRALRGSGPDGLAAMRMWRAFGHAWLWRPLLDTPRAAIASYARAHGVRGIVDPSNADDAHDRNYLRAHVLPALRRRWPHAAQALATAATRSRKAADLLDAGDDDAFAACMAESRDTLRASALREFPPERAARVLRRWTASLGLPPLPARGVDRILTDLLDAREDAQARFDWHGATVRAWCGVLHAMPVRAPLDASVEGPWDGLAPFGLPHGGALALDPPARLPDGVRVRARTGGERIRLAGRTHSHALKHVLQDARVPSWTREQLPLLVDRDEVLAAGDVACSAAFSEWLEARSTRLVWTRPSGA